jgi:integrase
MKAAGDNRYGHRDASMILLAFRHGLRASELCSLRWEQVDLTHGRLHVTRAKNGIEAFIPSPAANYAPCAAFSANRSSLGATYSCPSGVRL